MKPRFRRKIGRQSGLPGCRRGYPLQALLLPLLLGLLPSCGEGPGSPAESADYEGLSEPLQPHAVMVSRAAGFLMSDKGTGGVQEEDGQPIPPYFYSFGICDYRNPDFGCGAPDQLTGTVSFPAFTCAVAIEAFTRYYVYSGDPEALDRALQFARWVLKHATPETDLLAGLPYSTQVFPDWGGGKDGPSIELDKAAMFALGLFRLSDMTLDPQFREAAERIARQLVGIQKSDGSWAFRVIPATGGVYRDYTSDQIPLVRLMDRLFEETGEEVFRSASGKAWQWLLDHPVRTRYWANFYEDMDDPESLVNFDTLETIRELLERRASQPGYLSLALANFRWVQDVFLLLGPPYPPLIPSIAEQTGFGNEQTLAGTSSSTAQWASVGLDVFEATGDGRTLKHALEAANVVASAQQGDGRLFTVTADANGAGLYPITWYEQCFVPLWFMLEILGKRPELAPSDENHLLRWSPDGIQEIQYGDDRVRYRTLKNGVETLKVAGRVVGVKSGTRQLPQIHFDEEVGDGWELQADTQLLRVRHTVPEVEIFLSSGMAAGGGRSDGFARPQPPQTIP